MKKLIAIILSAVLLFTSVISASMFTVSADGEAEPTSTDTVIIPNFVDAYGNEMNLPHTIENVPNSVTTHAGTTVVKNTTKFPFQSLFSIVAQKSNDMVFVDTEPVNYEGTQGVMFYVEIPDNDTIEVSYGQDTEAVEDDVTWRINDYRLSLRLNGYVESVDPETGAVSKTDVEAYDYMYGGPWYVMENGTSKWETKSGAWNADSPETSGVRMFYGIKIAHGFKGFVYIPYTTFAQMNGFSAGIAEGKTAYIDGFRMEQMTNQDNVVLSDGRVEYGKTSEQNPVIISAPVIVKSVDEETSLPDTKGVVVDGELQNYANGKALDYSKLQFISATSTRVIATGDVTTDTAGDATRGYREIIPSTSAVTDKPSTVKYSHRTNPGRTGSNPYPGLIYENDSSTATAAGRTLFDGTVARSSVSGFLFHVTIPATKITQEGYEWIYDTRQKIQMNFFGKNGQSRSMDQAANTSGSWYYLKDGNTSWTTVGPESFYKLDAEGNLTTEKDTYSLVVGDGTKEWSGYVYVPVKFQNNYGAGIDYFTEIRVGLSSYRHSTGAATKYPTSALAEGFKVSAVSLVSSFDINSTIATGDNGRVVDLATGDFVVNNYSDVDEFFGNEALVTKSEDLLAFKHLNTARSSVMHPLLTPTAGSGKAFSNTTDSFGTALVYSKLPAIKAPMLEMKNITEEAVTFANTRYLYINTDNIYAKDYEGVMLYIKNDTASQKAFNFRTYASADFDNDPTTAVTSKYTYAYGKVSVLVEGTDAWNSSSDVARIPANKAAWVYIPMASFTSQPFNNHLDDPESFIKDIDICTNSSFEVDQKVTFSYAMGVTKWTVSNVGRAHINGSTVAEDMWTGEFTAAYDYDGSLSTNLIDLVQAKEEASETEFTAFRNAYLNEYFNDAEYSVLSAAFSVAPLNYDRNDSSTILNENPDRGYRSEMVLYFASDPLKISETPDYTPQLLSGTGYTVDVSANAIFDSDIASGKREPETETDYNISNTPSNDRYPMGDGSGGAVHTVTVEVLQAWINAHNNYVQDRVNAKDGAYRLSQRLIQASEETLDNFYSRAAVHLVSNYMTYEIKRSDMFVNELVKVVYLNDDQKAQVKYTGAWSDRYFTIDGVERYIRVEGNAASKNFFYYDNTGCRVYNNDGSLKELKIHVYHDPRTIFASDSTAEWNSRLGTYFLQYKIGYKDVASKTYYTRKVTYADGTSQTIEIANNLFNAYLTFTEFAHSDELPAGVLDALDYFFKYCASVGAKANFRPSYNTFTQNAYLSQDVIGYQQFRNNVASQCADEETMIAHIKQMAPVVAANKDAIHNISSGWIGFGGEMAAGFQYPPVSYKNVITALLDYHCIPNGLYFSSRSSSYVTNIINGVEAVKGYNSGNLDLLYGLEADAEWTEKYAKWCGFNNDAFFGEQNFTDWGSGDYYKVGDASYAYDTANAAYTPNDGELYTNGSHVPTSLVIRDGKYVWVGFNDLESGNVDKYNDTDNNIPTPIEAILELAHHRYTDFSQWHGFLDVSTPNVMTFWMDHNAQWIFEGDIDSVEGNNALFNAEERAAEITKPITKADLEANGILYDPAYFANTDTVNAYEFIRDHLGYRLVAQDVNVNYNESKSDKVNVTVNLKNYGFGAAFNMESTLAIFDTEGNLVQQIKAGDPSTWYNLAPDYYTTKRNSSAQGDALIHSVSAGFDSLKDGTYYVGIKLANSAGTVARLANDVELNEQGYNILGHFNFARLSSEPTVKETLKVMSYNIRCLRGGESNAGYDPLTTDEISKTISNFYSLLSRENPDVMIVCENRMNFDGSATSTDEGMMNVYDNLFKRFFPYAYDLSTGASAPRIYSKYPLSDIEWLTVNYDGTNTQNRRPLAASIEVEGEKIYIIACHPAAGAEVYESDRVPYFQSILDYAANKDNVIFAGDLNTDSANPAGELAAFKNAGFTLGNFGDFGTFQTYRYGGAGDKYLDNIVVKGLEMKNFWVGEETYSDHFPVYSEIYLPLKND